MFRSKYEQEAIDYLREWAGEGFPRRVDGSFPSDFLSSMRRLTDIPEAVMPIREFERALEAGADFDHLRTQRRTWSWEDTKKWKANLS